MATTNQAFIRAYQPGQPRAAGTATARSAGHPLLSASVAYVSASVEGNLAATHLEVSPDSAPGSGSDASAGAAASRYVTAPSPAPGQGRLPWRVDSSAPVKRPLSSFSTRRQMAPPAAAQTITSAGTLRPDTIVASLRWPAVCRTLLQRAGDRYDHVAALLEAEAERASRLIGIIGLFPEVGCTTTLLCLAARLAARGRRVLAVDANFCRPKLLECLGGEPTAWWQEALRREAPLSEAVVRAVEDRVDLLPLDAGRIDPPASRDRRGYGDVSAELPPPMANYDFAPCAAALRQAYEIVLIDLGAFFDPQSQPVALEVARRMEIQAAISVSGAGRVDPRDLATVGQYLGQAGCAHLGVLENGVPELRGAAAVAAPRGC